jgi:hypothetical protein
MRGFLAILALGVAVAMPRGVLADDYDGEEVDDRELQRQINRDQFRALRDYHDAETDEEAEEAEQRFNDASEREVQRRRQKIDDLIESGGSLPPSPRPGPPHP